MLADEIRKKYKNKRSAVRFSNGYRARLWVLATRCENEVWSVSGDCANMHHGIERYMAALMSRLDPENRLTHGFPL